MEKVISEIIIHFIGFGVFYWLGYTRGRGETKEPLKESKCPRCGAPIFGNKCEYCGTDLRELWNNINGGE